MLPPIEQGVLQNNPDFAALYSTLTTAVLNPDGTTKDDHSRAARERDAVRKELDAHRLRSAKQHLLAQALSSAAPPEQQQQQQQPPKTAAPRRTTTARQPEAPSKQQLLPEPLLDLLLLLPPLLLTTSSPEEENTTNLALLLAHPPFSSLDALLPDLAGLVSAHLRASAVQLARAAHPAANPSFLHRHIPSVPAHFARLAADAKQQAAAVAAARRAAADALAALLANHTEALARLVRALEAKHGGIARSLELRGADVALAARRGEVDAEAALWNLRKDVYSPEVREALRNYLAHLHDGQRRLKEAARTFQAELVEYGVDADGDEGDAVRERKFREIARAHRDVRRQIDEARRDLSRLG